MNNTFNVNDYFTENFGLPSKPKMPETNKKTVLIAILLCLTLIGAIVGVPMLVVIIAKRCSANSKIKEWQDSYNERYNKWDGEVDRLYTRYVESMDVKQMAMEKLGIDEDQVKEVKPFSIYGQTYNGWYRFGADGEIRTDDREITWIFFGDNQIYLYTLSFSLTGREHKTESTQEFFYTDIVSVSTGSVSKTLNAKKSAGGGKWESVEAEEFRLVVPGDKMSFAFTSNNEISASIRGMKEKIRDKKNR